MKLKAFRVNNFKSVIDSGLIHLSVDHITTIIGQNESGKSALIEALDSYYRGAVSEKDIRHEEDRRPAVECVYATNEEELRAMLDGYQLPEAIIDAFKNSGWEFKLRRTWDADLEKGAISLVEPELSDESFVLEVPENTEPKKEEPEENSGGGETAESESQPEPEEPQPPTEKALNREILINLLFERSPEIVFFSKEEHILPSTIDIKSLSSSKTVRGKAAALNFLKLVGLQDLAFFNDRKNRAKIQHKIEKEAIKFTEEFQDFWQQEIGGSITGAEDDEGQKIEIKFGVDAHDQAEEAGTGSYLYFIVGDGKQLLHPEQRSQGMRWYISFYLQLRAYSMNGEKPQVIVMDEPGQFLHASAQEDLLKLFDNEANENVNIMYTTHSPFMVDGDTINRVIAAQRSPHKDNDGYSHTEVMSGFELGAASRSTLLPLMSHLGMRLSDQEVIKPDHNLITEEISATYYIRAFLKLLQKDTEINIIAATGADNVPQLCYEFLGWGIKFSILLDGDTKGKRVRNKLKEELYLNDNELTNKNMHLMRGFDGIEDLLTQRDFKKYVLGDETVSYSGKNSKYVNDKNLPKPVLAAMFLQRVKEGKIDIDDETNGLLVTSKTNIQTVTNGIDKLITHQIDDARPE